MANEIKLNWSLSVTQGNLNRRVPSATQNITMTETEPAMAGGIIEVGTTHEAIPLGDVATRGIGYVKNLGPTNFVEIGVLVSGTFYGLHKVKVGESYPIRFGSNAPYAKADTAAIKLEYEIYDD